MGSEYNHLVIHIGGHKCGSTSIQDYCAQNQDELISKGIFYPINVFQSYPRQHSELAKHLNENDLDYVERLFHRFSKEASAHGAGTVFISGEDLCTIKSTSVEMLSEIAGAHFRSRKFVFVERNATDFLLSSFKHRLRYGSIISESGFARQIKEFSPREAVETWREYFSLDGVFLHYDHISADFLSEFFRLALDVEVKADVRSNVSLDYLTLQIFNTFLKEWNSEEVSRILWDVSRRHPARMVFEIEGIVVDELRARLLEDEWRPIEFRGSRSLLDTVTKTRARGHSPIEVCDKMIDLFIKLREYFNSEHKVDPALISDDPSESD